MKKIEEKIKQLKEIRLTSEEKATSLTKILSYIGLKPEISGDGINNADHPNSTPRIINSSIFWHFTKTKKILSVTIAILLIFVVGAGVTVAAEKSSPGDLLYPIKINISEKVTGAFIVGDENLVKWKIQKIERRLQEVENLIIHNKFEERERIEAEERIKLSFQDFEKGVSKIDDDNQQKSLEFRSELETRLLVHGANIVDLKDKVSASSAVQIDKFISIINMQDNQIPVETDDQTYVTGSTNEYAPNLLNKTEVENTPVIQIDVEAKISKIRQDLQGINQKLEGINDLLPEIESEIKTNIDLINQNLLEAEKQVQLSKPDSADQIILEATRQIENVSALIDVSSKINIQKDLKINSQNVKINQPKSTDKNSNTKNSESGMNSESNDSEESPGLVEEVGDKIIEDVKEEINN